MKDREAGTDLSHDQKVSRPTEHRHQDGMTVARSEDKDDEFDIDIYADVKSPGRGEKAEHEVNTAGRGSNYMHPDRLRLLGMSVEDAGTSPSTRSRDRGSNIETIEHSRRDEENSHRRLSDRASFRDSRHSPRTSRSSDFRRNERDRTHHQDEDEDAYQHPSSYLLPATHSDEGSRRIIRDEIQGSGRTGRNDIHRADNSSNARLPSHGSVPTLSEDARRLKEELRRASNAGRARSKERATHPAADTRHPSHDLFAERSEHRLPPRPPGPLPPRHTDQRYDNAERSRGSASYRQGEYDDENRRPSSYRARSRERRENGHDNLHSSGQGGSRRSRDQHRDRDYGNSSPCERRGPSHRDREPEMRSNNYHRPRDYRSRSPPPARRPDRRAESPRARQKPTFSIKGHSERSGGLSIPSGGIQFKGAASRTNYQQPLGTDASQPRVRSEQSRPRTGYRP